MTSETQCPVENVTRVRQLFDEAVAETFDALFQAPDIVEVVSAVAAGDLAIVISGATVQVLAVQAPVDDAASPPAPVSAPSDESFGMYL